MLFVPPSMPSSEAQEDYTIPSWIKNNASWWADGKINDDSFLKGIEYLVNNLILEIPSNKKSNENGFLLLDKHRYELPSYTGTTEINLFGKFPDAKPNNKITVVVTNPDGKTDEYNIMMANNAFIFNYVYMIKSDFPQGQYQISITHQDGTKIGPITFTLVAQFSEKKIVPAWVKNSAGWWSSGAISNGEFINALQFLVKEGIIKLEQKAKKIGRSINPDLLVYRTNVTILPDRIVGGQVIKTDPFTVIVVYSTQNETCSIEEKRIASSYAKMSEHLLNKLNRPNKPTEVIGVCMELHEIVENT